MQGCIAVVLLICAASLSASAQWVASVKGTVISKSDNLPLIGVSVADKGQLGCSGISSIRNC
jgi:hypothetical protein